MHHLYTGKGSTTPSCACLFFFSPPLFFGWVGVPPVCGDGAGPPDGDAPQHWHLQAARGPGPGAILGPWGRGGRWAWQPVAGPPASRASGAESCVSVELLLLKGERRFVGCPFSCTGSGGAARVCALPFFLLNFLGGWCQWGPQPEARVVTVGAVVFVPGCHSTLHWELEASARRSRKASGCQCLTVAVLVDLPRVV